MIITMPVDGKTMNACINKSFGRTQTFLVYDTETHQNTFLANAAVNSQGGAGIQAAQFVVDQKTNAVLAPSIGKNAADVLTGAGVELYTTSDCSIQDNIAAFLDGKLEKLSEIHAGFHNHGGR